VEKKIKMGMVNNVHGLMMVVSMVICLTSVANAAEGTATFYTPPYVREYLYLYVSNWFILTYIKYHQLN
jgi:hypothetical protein